MFYFCTAVYNRFKILKLMMAVVVAFIIILNVSWCWFNSVMF